MEINQFHSGTAVGDAITNQMLTIQEILQRNGYTSAIYAQHIPQQLRGRILPIADYKGSLNNILFVHHSMGFDGFENIVALPDKKAMIYHNITPEHFFEDASIKRYIWLGLWQAAEYRKHLDYFIADSNYNRQELLKMGHRRVDVMPVQSALNRFDAVTADEEVLRALAGRRVILFVGRIVKNKRQEDILRAFALYHRGFAPESILALVGDTAGGYAAELEVLAKALKVEGAVIMPGKVSEAALKAYYQSAALFLCMSEHEGFGVPLLEAMAMGVPVMAYRSSAIAETLSGAGILLLDKSPVQVAGVIQTVLSDRELCRRIVEKQHARLKKLQRTDTEKILLKAIDSIRRGNRPRTIQMQGPFETSYSLAIVNRKLAEALDDLHLDDLSIYCTEGPGDYRPQETDLADKPHAKALWEHAEDVTYPDVTIRNMYPPRVADANGGINFLAFGWEEDRVPSQYVEQFNRCLSGIGTMSDFVTDALKASGLRIPVQTMGIGVELPANYKDLNPYHLNTKKSIVFLHISSAFPRKGVDILLKAYFKTFTSKDDVCLVLKTFPNPHNQVGELLRTLKTQYPEGPEVEWIDKDLPEDKLYGLYRAASCYVHSARGEGFGLPVAEAMLAGVPVIVSPNTGMADFCREDTASLVPYHMEQAQSHLSVSGARWACPDGALLGRRMREFAAEPSSLAVRSRVKAAQELIATRFTWQAVAGRWVEFINKVEDAQWRPRVAMVTTWNNKCGIAEYTRFQCEAMQDMTAFSIYPNCGVTLLRPDEPYVKHRLWESAFHGDLEKLVAALAQSDEEIVHFQFNFGFFALKYLAAAIDALAEKKKLIITFHKTKDSDVGGTMVSLSSIKDSLNRCYRLIVHQPEDREVLEGFGVSSKRIEIIPHGQITYEAREKEAVRQALGISRGLVLGSYGFLLPHKGVLEVIQALPELKKIYPDVLYIVCCAMHESEESKTYYQACKSYAASHHLDENVTFITDFLPMEESMVLLQACDVLLMTYLPTQESASGAVRFCVAAERPLITTQQKIFKEFSDCTIQIATTAPKEIAAAVSSAMNADLDKLLTRMKARIAATSWETVSRRLDALYRKALME